MVGRADVGAHESGRVDRRRMGSTSHRPLPVPVAAKNSVSRAASVGSIMASTTRRHAILRQLAGLRSPGAQAMSVVSPALQLVDEAAATGAPKTPGR